MKFYVQNLLAYEEFIFQQCFHYSFTQNNINFLFSIADMISPTSLSTPNTHSKHQIQQYYSKHLQGFHQLNTFIEKISMRIQKDVQKMQAIKLEEFKQDLQKTRNQFNQMNQKRKEKAIKKAVYTQKKQLEKECSNFLEKSIEVNKIYQKLKNKLTNMESNEQELNHQIQYLHKRIKVAAAKTQNLKKQYKVLEQSILYPKPKPKNYLGSTLTQNKINNSMDSVLLASETSNQHFQSIQNSQSLSSSIKNQRMLRTKYYQQNTENRLRQKIENTKQFMDSLIFQKSFLEEIFQQSIVNSGNDKENNISYMDEKKKIYFVEELLKKDQVKREIYGLIFEE